MHLKTILLLALLYGGSVFYTPAYAKPPLPAVKPDIESGHFSKVLGRIGSLFSNKTETPVPIEKPDLSKATSKAPYKKKTAFPARFLKTHSIQKTLTKTDTKLYTRIFAAQKAGDMLEANEILKKISNPLLLGHILYQRYMHPNAYNTDYKELKEWLSLYADHPGANKIYSLAQKKSPDRTTQGLTKPLAFKAIARVHEPTMRPAKHYKSTQKRTEAEHKTIRAIRKKIKSLIRKNKPDEALALLGEKEITQNFDMIELDLLKSEMAASLLYQGDINSAGHLATQAVTRSALYVPKAAWVTGLISWKQQDYTRAARFFETAARSAYASGWMVTAASYWAARAHMRSGKIKAVTPWLQRGVQHPRTFYGLVSTRALGHDFQFNWSTPSLTKELQNTLTNTPAGARALALIQIGQIELAQTELLRRRPETPQERKAFLAFAHDKNLPALSMRLAGATARPESGTYYDAALYPTIPWTPKNGYTINKALVHAIIKQESRFNPQAKSFSGATGLMQLMPATAKGIAKDKANNLKDPHTSLEIGQLYLKHLLNMPAVENNLLYLLIAYNAGPGNLIKWKKRWPDVHDPLLFIELIPSSETRAYIEHVLANYWIYRMKEEQTTQTLDLVASGKAPLYKP